MECCGNTIKDLYGFSCPLKCSTYILQSVVLKRPWDYPGLSLLKCRLELNTIEHILHSLGRVFHLS